VLNFKEINKGLGEITVRILGEIQRFRKVLPRAQLKIFKIA
jgi:hypothetical protein